MNNCVFANCGIELSPDSKFTLCERCRIIDNRNRMALVTDPHSALPSAYRGHIQAVVTQMSGAEMVRYIEDQEKVYLEFCKLRKLYAPEASSRRVKLTLVEEINETRNAEAAVSVRAQVKKKAAKKAESLIEKQMRTLGCDEKTAKRIFNDDYSDL